MGLFPKTETLDDDSHLGLVVAGIDGIGEPKLTLEVRAEIVGRQSF